MKNGQIIENNKLIATFMGYTYFPYNHPDIKSPRDAGWKIDAKVSSISKWNIGYTKKAFLCRSHNQLNYDGSWQWIMPVVEKIARMRIKYLNEDEYFSPYPVTFGMIDDEGNFMVRFHSHQLFQSSSFIEAVWMAVIDFIKSYNEDESK
jgi:hypothetical protein